VKFLDDGLKDNNWPAAVQKHYGAKDLGVLQNTWLTWVKQGAPLAKPGESAPTQLLAVNGRRPRPEPNLIYREPPTATTPLTPVRGAASDATELAASTRHNDPKVLPAAGWHPVGQRDPAVMADSPLAGSNSPSTQVAHPQPFEQPRQTILR
jgi:hypothetical protein